MKTPAAGALALALLGLGGPALAQLTFYEHSAFDGRAFSTDRQVGDLQRTGFHDRAGSVIVRDKQWEVCDDAWFSGECRVLRPGRYPDLAALGLSGRPASVREVHISPRMQAYVRFAPTPPTLVGDLRLAR